MKNNRYLILLSAGILAAVLGSEYVWSIYSEPLRIMFGWKPGQVTLTYSLFLVFGTIGVFLYGKIASLLPAKYIALLGGTMQGGGFLLSGFVSSLPALYFTYSFIGGIGNGLLYNGSVSIATGWFPDKKGTASGICVGFLGLAPVVWSLLGNHLIEVYDVQISFRILGAILILCSWLVAWFMERAPEGYRPDGWEPDVNSLRATGKDYTPAEMVRTPLFYLAMLCMLLHCCAGLSMTGNAAAIALDIVNMTPHQASLQVALLAVGSFIGRIVFGAVSDKIGRFNVQLLTMTITAMDMFFFIGHTTTFAGFMTAIMVIGIGYGGIVATLPAFVSDCFGQKYFSINYSIIFLGFTLAGIAGPMVTSLIYQYSGSYQGAFIFSGCIAVIGAAATVVTRIIYIKEKQRVNNGSDIQTNIKVI